MTDKISELKPKVPPEVQRAQELQARVNAASAVLADKLIRARSSPDPEHPGSIVVDVDIPKMFVGQKLFEIQFNSLINLLAKMGIGQEMILTALAEGLEKAVAETVRDSIVRPGPASTIQPP